MTTVLQTISNTTAYYNAAPKESPVYNTNQVDKNTFDKLFRTIFDNLKMQKLVANKDLSDILCTIADISNNHNK